jgi:hypothetical protein
MRELAVFKASENVVESSKVSHVVILPRFRKPTILVENCIPNSFDNATQERNK